MESEPVPSAVSLDPKPERIIKKIPGKIIPAPKEKEVYMGNLASKSTVDLKELLERQNRILANKSLLVKLADKGSKATELKTKIERELKSRDDVDKTANLLSEMSLSQLNALEWTGHCNPGHRNKLSKCQLNPDFEETDPLKILASHSGTTSHQKQLSLLKSEESLIKPEDLIDSEGSANPDDLTAKSSRVNGAGSAGDSVKQSLQGSEGTYGDVNEKSLPSCSLLTSRQKTHPLADEPEPYAHLICERYGHKDVKERFKPNKPLKPFSGTFPLKPPGRISTKPRLWEETNVTPPLAVYVDTKVLSLEESIEIQREQNQKLKEVQLKHAAEKLSSLPGFRTAEQIPASVLSSMAHRGAGDNSDSGEEYDEEELEEHELHDEDQQDRGGTVVYNIES